MEPIKLRPAVPRRIQCYGGPSDGETMQSVIMPEGYIDYGGALVLWHAINVALIPMWQGRTK